MAHADVKTSIISVQLARKPWRRSRSPGRHGDVVDRPEGMTTYGQHCRFHPISVNNMGSVLSRELFILKVLYREFCPSGVVVETTLKELLPAIINWGNNRYQHISSLQCLYVSRSFLLNFQRCPPLSGVEGSVESHLLVLGEQERWNLDVLLRMLAELLPFVHQKAIETCPFSSVSESNGTIFSSSVLELYAGGHVEWPAFEWVNVDCFSCLLLLACFLPQKEDKLRNRITQFLLTVSECFGDSYLTHIMLPLFLVAVGGQADLKFFPPNVHSRIKGLRPRTAVAERLTILGILPLLLAGVLGSPGKHQELADYLRKLLVEGATKESRSATHNMDIVDAVRFLCHIISDFLSVNYEDINAA
ncbi:uncharacterized protein LOC120130646 [Hibiscus syriacus]|uniref:uncharacterized protein LOC120130646 n=1 Tax=Hibiscus syriacus TaxID=106335 RepID=UPI001923F7BC|nr:uncharacterized protein LOC120130646 [Hibiscus syriacus]